MRMRMLEHAEARERIDVAVTLSFGDHQQIALGHRLSASGSWPSQWKFGG